MSMTRREMLAGMSGAVALPFASGGPFNPLSAFAFPESWLNAESSPSAYISLNATPAWSIDLSGSWKIEKDPANRGKQEEWFKRGPTSKAVEQKIPNPLQGVFPGYNGVVWYWRSFEMGPESFDDIRIHFGGVDYFAEAWLNGRYIGSNESALLPFAFDAKEAAKAGQNDIVVRIIDACYAQEIDGFRLGNVPGGRQHDNPWEPGFRHFNYGGLLQPVSVQAFRRPWIADAFIRPSVGAGKIDVDLTFVGNGSERWSATVRPKSGVGAETHKQIEIDNHGDKATFSMSLNEPHPWDVWDGFLYELELTPQTRGTVWRGTFGLREISIVDRRIAVNGRQSCSVHSCTTRSGP